MFYRAKKYFTCVDGVVILPFSVFYCSFEELKESIDGEPKTELYEVIQ